MLVKIACTRHVLVNIAPNDKENPIAKNQERICNTSEQHFISSYLRLHYFRNVSSAHNQLDIYVFISHKIYSQYLSYICNCKNSFDCYNTEKFVYIKLHSSMIFVYFVFCFLLLKIENYSQLKTFPTPGLRILLVQLILVDYLIYLVYVFIYLLTTCTHIDNCFLRFFLQCLSSDRTY